MLWGQLWGFEWWKADRADTWPCNCLNYHQSRDSQNALTQGKEGDALVSSLQKSESASHGWKSPAIWDKRVCKCNFIISYSSIFSAVDICVSGWKMTHVILRSVLCFLKWKCHSRTFQNLGGKMFGAVKASSWYIIYYDSILGVILCKY